MNLNFGFDYEVDPTLYITYTVEDRGVVIRAFWGDANSAYWKTVEMNESHPSEIFYSTVVFFDRLLPVTDCPKESLVDVPLDDGLVYDPWKPLYCVYTICEEMGDTSVGGFYKTVREAKSMAEELTQKYRRDFFAGAIFLSDLFEGDPAHYHPTLG